MTSSSSPIFRSPGEDKEMEAAGAKARQTFRYFWREIAWERRRIIPGLELAAIKASFSDPPGMRSKAPDALDVEHMWLIDVDFNGRKLEGTLINSPHSLTSIKEGDRVALTGKQLCDWMYVIAGKVYGGFTVDLMRSRMSKAERKQHDNAWGYDFGEVGIVHLVPPSYIDSKETKPKGFFARFKAAPPAAQDYAAVDAAEHPMSVNMRDSLDQTLSQNPAMVHDAAEDGYTFLHQLSLAGSLDGVDVCLKHGADPNKAATNGMTPLALAKTLGWKRVIDRLQKAGATGG